MVNPTLRESCFIPLDPITPFEVECIAINNRNYEVAGAVVN